MTAKAAKPAGWKPVPVAVQQQNIAKQIRGLRHKKVLTVAQQRRQHQVTVAKAAKAKHHKKAKTHGAPLAVGDVACCAAEALAMSLRLAGWTVTGRDVLDLYWLTAEDPGEGATIGDTFAAADAAGWPPGGDGLIVSVGLPQGLHAVVAHDGVLWSWGEPWLP